MSGFSVFGIMKLNKKSYFLVILFCIFAAILIRLPYVSCPYMIAYGGDTAAIGLMIMDIAMGRFHTFYYGQAYNGPIEAYIVAPFVRLLGVSNYVFFSGAMFIFIILLISTYLLVREFSNRRAGLFALLYLVIPPFYFYRHNMELQGYHMSILILGNIIFTMTLRICSQPDRYLFYGIFGLLAGLGLWSHYSIFYYLISAVLFLVSRVRFLHLLKGGVIGILPFFLGSMPWWIYNIRYGFRSLNLYDGHPSVWFPVEAGWWEVLKRFIGFHIFGILGIDLYHIFGWLLLIIYSVSFLLLFFRGRNSWLFILFFIIIITLPVKNKYFVWYVTDDYRIAITIFSIIPLAVSVTASRLKWLGSIFAAVVIGINGWYLNAGLDEQRARLFNKYRGYSDLINFFRENKIKGIISEFIKTQDINFITKKKIVGAELFYGRAPTDLDVDTRDRIAFISTEEFVSDINRLCYRWKEGYISGQHILYGFIPFPYYGRVLDRTGWEVEANSRNHNSGYAIDGNLNRSWITHRDNQVEACIKINLGGVHSICKLEVFNIAPHLHNHPNGYKIEVSLDGIVWDEMVRFETRPMPLFWSGPRIYWDLLNGRWEQVFSPVKARFLKITQLNCGPNPWVVNEIYVYEYLGQKNFRIKDYIKDARKIYNFLVRNGIGFVYGDYWISNKIRSWSGGRIGTLQRYNECWPGRKYTSRMMDLDNRTAIIVPYGNEGIIDEILHKFNLHIEKRKIGNFICYLFNNPEWDGCLYWTGMGIARVNPRIATMLINKDKQHILRRKFAPAKKMDIEFSNGVRFKGYTIRIAGKRYQISYFWEFSKELKKYTVAFVHFTKDNKKIFQNDHQLLEQYVKPITGKILVERYWLDIPEPGRYEIQLGLYTTKRLKVRGGGLYSPTKINIGEIEVK